MKTAKRAKTSNENRKLVVGNRIRSARLGLGLNLPDWKAETGLSARTIQDAERGVNSVNAETLTELAHRGVDLNWVLTGAPCTMPGPSGPHADTKTRMVLVPILNARGEAGRAKAPFYLGTDASETPGGFTDVEHLCAFRMPDNSMTPTFHPGDWALCIPCHDRFQKAGLYVVGFGNHRSVRRLRPMTAGMLEVRQDNVRSGNPFLVSTPGKGRKRKRDIAIQAYVVGRLGAAQ